MDNAGKTWNKEGEGACTFSFVARCDCQEVVGKGRVSVVNVLLQLSPWLMNLSRVVSGG